MVYEDIEVSHRRELKKLLPRHLKERILRALQWKPKPQGKKKRTTNFWIFAKQDRDSDVHRKDITQFLSQAILEQFEHWTAREPADVELWSFVNDIKVALGVRLTTLSFRQRRYRREERSGSLPPPIAAALIAMSSPAPSDRFLDPMCGSGTVVIERAMWGAAHSIVGGDNDETALASAERAARAASADVRLYHWDAGDPEKLKSHTDAITTIVCNMPFGKKFATAGGALKMYARLIESWNEVLAPRGKMILLGANEEALHRACRSEGLKPKTLARLRVRGFPAVAVRAEKKA
jgi:23S rRNA G2445 N2-methylase RlmL